MKKTKRNIKVNAILLIGIVICLFIFRKNGTANEIQTVQVSGSYELPQIGLSEKVISHIGYSVSFNSDWHIPNWVAYELTADEVAGTESRSDKFIPDPMLPSTPSTDEYKNSGYDRGHMAPAADMKWSKQAMNESFYTSNICPQNHNLNGGDWKDLEEHVRNMAVNYDHIYVTCGPIVSTHPSTIGCSVKIAVPDAFYKVILRQKNDSWSAIGFMMPNRAGHNPLKTYAMSVDDIEIITDIDFFVALPDSIEEKIESSYNLQDWNL